MFQEKEKLPMIMISVFLFELLFLRSPRTNSFFNRNVMKFSTKSYQNFYFRTSVKKPPQMIQESEKNKKFENSVILSKSAYSP